jgi:secreted trypsin-like serine protease
VQELKFKITLVLSILFCSLLSSPAQAITFGEEVMSASSEYPSVVSIWYTTSITQDPIFYCTGTLIENDIVLTAAHCVEEVGVYFIKYETNLRKDSYFREVSATWKSPNYSSDQLVGDVGLLKLTDPIAGAQTVPLLSSSEIKKVLLDKKKKLEIVGWGKDQNSIFPQYLKKLVVDDYSIAMKKNGKVNGVIQFG